MTSLRLTSLVSEDEWDLDSQLKTGLGVQALSGVNGIGMPPVSVQWSEGAGDGSTFRGQRLLARDIDIRLNVLGRDRAHLVELVRSLGLTLSGPCRLYFREDDGQEWYADVIRVGGGGFVYGTDTTGERELNTVVTFRSGDPYWTSVNLTRKILNSGSTTTDFLSSLASMPVSSSQQIGSITLENRGNAQAFPLWEIRGPGHSFVADLGNGSRFEWNGALAEGESLLINTQQGTVTDGTGANRYGELGSAPRLWAIPPGIWVAEASLIDTSAATSVACSWATRRWMLV